MMKAFHYIIAIAALLGASSCSEIEDGTTDIDSWPDAFEAKEYTFTHPCMLHTADDIAYVRGKLQAGQQPWTDAYAVLTSNQYSSLTREPVVTEYINRTPPNEAGGYPNNGLNFSRDCAAIYQLALRYVLEDDILAAERAKRYAAAWVKDCKGIWYQGNSNNTLLLFQVYQIANGLELLRGYQNYGESQEFKDVCDWLCDIFYPAAHDFLVRHHGTEYNHYWLNWDLAAMSAVLSLGILTDNQDWINEAIIYYKNGIGSGYVMNAVPFMYSDPDGTGVMLGQCNESGRDQGHATLCASLMGSYCMMAYNVGEDLFTYENGRAIALAEYAAKLNTPRKGMEPDAGVDNTFQHSYTTLPYTPHIWCPDANNKTGERNELGLGGRGTKRPGWDLWLGHCKRVGIETHYIDEFAEYLRPDGAAAAYDSNTGGFDQIGCTTLMFYYE